MSSSTSTKVDLNSNHIVNNFEYNDPPNQQVPSTPLLYNGPYKVGFSLKNCKKIPHRLFKLFVQTDCILGHPKILFLIPELRYPHETQKLKPVKPNPNHVLQFFKHFLNVV